MDSVLFEEIGTRNGHEIYKKVKAGSSYRQGKRTSIFFDSRSYENPWFGRAKSKTFYHHLLFCESRNFERTTEICVVGWRWSLQRPSKSNRKALRFSYSWDKTAESVISGDKLMSKLINRWRVDRRGYEWFEWCWWGKWWWRHYNGLSLSRS